MAPLHDESRRHWSRRHSIHPARHRLIVRIILDAIDRVLILIDVTSIAFTKLSTKLVHQTRSPMHTIVFFVFISISGPKDVVDALYTLILSWILLQIVSRHHWPPASKRLPIRVLTTVRRIEQ